MATSTQLKCAAFVPLSPANTEFCENINCAETGKFQRLAENSAFRGKLWSLVPTFLADYLCRARDINPGHFLVIKSIVKVTCHLIQYTVLCCHAVAYYYYIKLLHGVFICDFVPILAVYLLLNTSAVIYGP